MTKFEQIIETAEKIDFVDVFVFDDGADIVVNDFAGFTNDWEEIYNDVDDDAVDSLCEMLGNPTHSGYLYYEYQVDGMKVSLEYTSADV